METIAMSRKERKRLEAFSRVQAGDLTLVAAGELLGLSYRQTKRSWSRYRSQGDAGLVHRLRGRPSNRQSQDELKQRSLALYRLQYADYGPTLAVECLAAEDDVVVTETTLRRWLTQAGMRERRRKPQQNRRRRPRREQRGELLQMDGSHHDWFEGRRGWAVLMVLIDDATGRGDGPVLRERIMGFGGGFVSAVRPEAWPAARSVRGSAQHLPTRSRTDGRGITRRFPAGNAIRPGDAAVGSGVDFSPQSASEGSRGTDERNASRSVGEGVAAGGDRRTRRGQQVFGRRVPTGVQPPLWRDGVTAGRRPSAVTAGDGSGPRCVGSRMAGGGQRLDSALAKLRVAIAVRGRRVHAERMPGDGL